jgi:hypothetical protein
MIRLLNTSLAFVYGSLREEPQQIEESCAHEWIFKCEDGGVVFHECSKCDETSEITYADWDAGKRP